MAIRHHRTKENNMRPLVIVEISGGVAEATPYGEVDVLHIDWDSLQSIAETADGALHLGRDRRLMSGLTDRIPDPRHRQRILDDIEALRARSLRSPGPR
jgi:hypothetical protein